jgi:hypothetical protein
MVTLHGCDIVQPEFAPSPTDPTSGTTGRAKFEFNKKVGFFSVNGSLAFKYAFDVSTCYYNLEIDNEHTEIFVQLTTPSFSGSWKPEGAKKFSSDVAAVDWRVSDVSGTIRVARGNEGFKTWNLKVEAGKGLVKTGLVDLGDYSIPLPTPLLDVCKPTSPTDATQDPTPSPTPEPAMTSQKQDVDQQITVRGKTVKVKGYVTFKYAFDLSTCYFNVEIDTANTQLKFSVSVFSKTWVPSGEIKFSSDIVKVNVELADSFTGDVYLEKGNAGFKTWKLGLGALSWSPYLSMGANEKVELMEYSIPLPVEIAESVLCK